MSPLSHSRSFASLTRSFASLTRPFASLSRSFASLTRLFASLTRLFASLTRSFASLTRPFASLSRSFASLTRSFASLSRSFTSLTRSFASLTQSFASLTRPLTRTNTDVPRDDHPTGRPLHRNSGLPPPPSTNHIGGNSGCSPRSPPTDSPQPCLFFPPGRARPSADHRPPHSLLASGSTAHLRSTAHPFSQWGEVRGGSIEMPARRFPPHQSPRGGRPSGLTPPVPTIANPSNPWGEKGWYPPFTHPICSSRVLRFQPHVALPFPSTASHRRRPTSPRTRPSSSGTHCEGTLNLTLPKPSFPSQNIASPNHLPPLATSVSQNFTSPNPLSPIATFPAVSCPTMALHLPSRTKFPIYPPTSSSPHPPTSSYPLNSPRANHLSRLACFPNNFFPSLPIGPNFYSILFLILVLTLHSPPYPCAYP